MLPRESFSVSGTAIHACRHGGLNLFLRFLESAYVLFISHNFPKRQARLQLCPTTLIIRVEALLFSRAA